MVSKRQDRNLFQEKGGNSASNFALCRKSLCWNRMHLSLLSTGQFFGVFFILFQVFGLSFILLRLSRGVRRETDFNSYQTSGETQRMTNPYEDHNALKSSLNVDWKLVTYCAHQWSIYANAQTNKKHLLNCMSHIDRERASKSMFWHFHYGLGNSVCEAQFIAKSVAVDLW